MDEYAQYQGTFTSYMMAAAMSYSTQLSPSSSFGMSAKLSYQHLVELGTGSEKGKGTSTDFGFDLRRVVLNTNNNAENETTSNSITKDGNEDDENELEFYDVIKVINFVRKMVLEETENNDLYIGYVKEEVWP